MLRGCFEYAAVARYPDMEILAQDDVEAYRGELTVFLAQRRPAGYHDRSGGSVHTRIGPLIQ